MWGRGGGGEGGVSGEEKRKKKEKLVEKGKYPSEFSGGPEVYIVFFKLTGIGKRALMSARADMCLGSRAEA